MKPLTPAQDALLSYMEHASESRWCAGWLSSLDEQLAGESTYDWLVAQAGGTWRHTDRLLPPEERVNGRDLIWVSIEPETVGASPSHEPPKLRGHIPTKTAPMREAIIIALARLEHLYPGEGFLTPSITFVLEEMYEEAFHGVDWDMRGPFDKAYARAMEQLRAEGIIITQDANGIERRLFIFATPAED